MCGGLCLRGRGPAGGLWEWRRLGLPALGRTHPKTQGPLRYCPGGQTLPRWQVASHRGHGRHSLCIRRCLRGTQTEDLRLFRRDQGHRLAPQGQVSLALGRGRWVSVAAQRTHWTVHGHFPRPPEGNHLRLVHQRREEGVVCLGGGSAACLGPFVFPVRPQSDWTLVPLGRHHLSRPAHQQPSGAHRRHGLLRLSVQLGHWQGPWTDQDLRIPHFLECVQPGPRTLLPGHCRRGSPCLRHQQTHPQDLDLSRWSYHQTPSSPALPPGLHCPRLHLPN